MWTKLRSAFSLSMLVALLPTHGCSGDNVRPKDQTAADALKIQTTKLIEEHGNPLILDWDPEDRGSLEISMRDDKQGLVVVSFGKDGMKMLKDCRLPGSYAFTPMQRKERVLKLESANDIVLNLPTTGFQLVGNLQGELKQGMAIDIALVMIGKLRSTRHSAGRAMLTGKHCEEATHFVRSAVMGAFAMNMGTRGEARSAAQLFGAGIGGGTSSKKIVQTTDGDLERCRLAEEGELAKGCKTPLRLELYAIDTEADTTEEKNDDEASRNPCPAGAVWANGICTTKKQGPHTCTAGDLPACTEQCDGGDARSCFLLAEIINEGKKITRDRNKAVSLYEKACNNSVPDGCGKGGNLLIKEEPADVERSRKLFEKGCAEGDSDSCDGQGLMYALGVGVTKNGTRAVQLFRKACDAGNARACSNLGVMYASGQGAVRDEKTAFMLYQRGCDGGSSEGCNNVGLSYYRGAGVAKDVARAETMFKKSCERNDPEGCTNLATMLYDGMGITKDANKARELFKKSCESSPWSAEGCFRYGQMYSKGDGVPRDIEKAKTLFTKSCDANHGDACAVLAQLKIDEAKTPEEKAKARGAVVGLYERACTQRDVISCMEAGNAYAAGGSVPKNETKATQMFQTACNLGDKVGCYYYGNRLVQGLGISASPWDAVAVLQQNCTVHPQSCTTVGSWFATGQYKLEKNYAKAAYLYGQGCNQGKSGAACMKLSELYESGGIGLPKNADEAAKLVRTACDLKDQSACNKIASQELLASSKKGCEGGKGEECAVLGSLYRYGRGTPKDSAKAFGLMKKACEKNSGKGCSDLGYMYYYGEGTKPEPAKAYDSWKKSCDARSGEGCASEAWAHEEAIGTPKNIVKAATLYAKSCDFKHPEGCIRAADFYYNGRAGSPDPIAGAKYYKAACDAGVGRGCHIAGLLYQFGKGVTKDELEAGKMYKAGCDLAYGKACADLGWLVRYGAGTVKKDVPVAFSYFGKACDLGDDIGCAVEGWMVLRGEGTTKNEKRGIELLDSGCNSNMAGCCTNLGAALHHGEGVPRDNIRAYKAFEKGCKLGENQSCVNVGYMRWAGEDIPKDETKAIATFNDLCSKGFLPACTKLADMQFIGTDKMQKNPSAAYVTYEKDCDASPDNCANQGMALALGIGVKQNEIKAAQLFKKSCDNDSDFACELLAVMLDTGSGGIKDATKAMELYKKGGESRTWSAGQSCRLGFSRSCTSLGMRLLRLNNDQDGGKAALLKGCDMGDQLACDQLKTLK